MAGVIAAWLGDAVRPARRAWGPLLLPAACAALAVLPDLDLVFDSHRTVTHSLGATVLVGLVAGGVAWRLRLPILWTGLVCGAAYGTHVLLDWLGKDAKPPIGIMALWPLSREYYKSSLDLFLEVSRRFDEPARMLAVDLRSAARELLVLGPIAVVAWLIRRARQ